MLAEQKAPETTVSFGWQKKAKPVDVYRAWILNLGDDLKAAVSFHEMSQVIISPTLFDIPLTVAHARKVLIRGQDIIPMLYLPTLLNASHDTPEEVETLGLVVFQEQAYAALRYAALYLQALPVAVEVTNAQACTLPEDQPLWNLFALSCFLYEGEKVPVLDLVALFSAELLAEVS